ncbi:MAG: enoyl-CoA hydratase/isomerase family protein [Deltaproteobacteria bacterium]|nr:enoyl-CoA hydratase/isomerase family protein [Deltaproteobacteria bacterium]
MAVHAAREGMVGTLTLDRPEKAHAYDRAHLDEILERSQALARDVGVIVVQSTGDRAFCGGADLDAMNAASFLDALELRSQRVFECLSRLSCVTIAAVQGPAIAGGFELALACDLRVAGPAARFALPETALGIIPSAGGTTRLAALVGASRAKAVVLGGDGVSAEQALSWGLVHRLSTDPRAEAARWGEQIAARDVVALRLAKQVMDAEASAASLARERVAEAILYARKRPEPL